MYGQYLILVLFSLGKITLCRPSFEPHCSRFDYDEKLLEKMVRMEHANEVMFTNVEDLKNQAKQNLDSGLEGLEERVMQKIGQMEHTNEVMYNNAKEFTDKTTKYLETLKKDLDEKLANITSLQETESNSRKTGKAYSFSAYWLSSTSPANNDVIVFTRTLYDKGDVYNNKTGKVTAPVTGIYLFTAVICINSNSWMNFQFMADGTRIGAFVAGDKYWSSCSSGSATAPLSKGSVVWLRAHSVDHGEKLRNSNDNGFNGFTGTLIYETDREE